MRNVARFFAVLAVALGASAAWGEETAVGPETINRPYRPGRTYALNCNYEHTVTTTAGIVDRAPEVKTETLQCALTGRVSEAELDEKGNLKKYRLTIGRLTKAGRDAIRPGSVVLFQYVDGDKYFKGEEQTVPDNTKPLIRHLVAEVDVHYPGLDEAIGSKAPRKSGEAWSVDAKALSGCFDGNVLVTAFNVTGTSTLKEGAAGSRTKRLDNALTVKDFNTPFVPKDALMERSVLTIKQTMVLPEDGTLPVRDVDYMADVEATFTTVHGTAKGAVKAHCTFQQTIVPEEGKAAAGSGTSTKK